MPSLCSDGNVNSGQVSSDSLNKSFSLQTPAYDFVIQNKSVCSNAFITCTVDIHFTQQVSSYPGEVTQLTLLSYDEQNFPTSESYRISTGLSYQQISVCAFSRSRYIFTFYDRESHLSLALQLVQYVPLSQHFRFNIM